MSATHGKASRLGGPDDWFETPAWCVRRFLEADPFPAQCYPQNTAGARWVEPAAGNGAIIKAVAAHGITVPFDAFEIREEERANLEAVAATVTIENFLSPFGAAPRSARVVISNPPFQDAMPFITTAIECYPLAWVAFLLRLPFLASEARSEFFRGNRPDVYVLPNRPSFTGNGKTDATDYCWCVWPPAGAVPAGGSIRWLASTPASERRAPAPCASPGRRTG